jgi:branched-chain amino acid transport system substrate-binding protein
MARRLLSIIVISVVALVSVVNVLPASAQDIRIGFTPPVTGASAAEGAFQIKALKLALKEINAAGGINGKKIDLRQVDNQSSNPGALAAPRRLWSRKRRWRWWASSRAPRF